MPAPKSPGVPPSSRGASPAEREADRPDREGSGDRGVRSAPMDGPSRHRRRKLVVLVVGLALLFTGRYPPSLFDLIMGINRWVYRVTAYVASCAPSSCRSGSTKAPRSPAPPGTAPKMWQPGPMDPAPWKGHPPGPTAP